MKTWSTSQDKNFSYSFQSHPLSILPLYSGKWFASSRTRIFLFSISFLPSFNNIFFLIHFAPMAEFFSPTKVPVSAGQSGQLLCLHISSAYYRHDNYSLTTVLHNSKEVIALNRHSLTILLNNFEKKLQNSMVNVISNNVSVFYRHLL